MPQVFYGPYDERNSDYANSGNAMLGRFPLGHTLELPDGRQYKFTLNDSTVEIAGNLYQSVASVAGHVSRPVDVVRAIDATSVSATLVTTAAAVDIYAEGITHVNPTPGQGYAYRNRRAFTVGNAHAASVASGVLTLALAPGEMLQVALTTASQLTFTRNRYHQVLISAAPLTAGVAGVSPGVAAADRFYWSQVKGYAAVLGSGTLLAGLPVMAGITTAGSVEGLKRRVRSAGVTVNLPTTLVMVGLRMTDQDGNTTDFMTIATVSTYVTTTMDITGGIAINSQTIGTVIKANVTADFSLIDLAIPTS